MPIVCGVEEKVGEGGRVGERNKGSEEIYQNVKRVSKLQFVCIKHALYYISIIPQ